MEAFNTFDIYQAEKTLKQLQQTIAAHRESHGDDDGIRNRMARVCVLKSQINAYKKKLKASHLALEESLEKYKTKKGDAE